MRLRARSQVSNPWRRRGRGQGLFLVALGVVLPGLMGCPPPDRTVPVQFLSMAEAVQAVNANVRRLQAGLRSNSVQVQAELVYDGQKRRFDLQGKLGFLKPNHLYLLLEHSLGTEAALQIGSNDRECWVWARTQMNKLWYGERDDFSRLDAEAIPVHPNHLIESLGLTEIPGKPFLDGPFFTVWDEENQLIFIGFDARDQGFVRKEYWLDRRPPFLVRRIVFRWPDGRVAMRTHLDDYRGLEGGPLFAHHIRIEWPAKEGYMDLRFRKVVLWPKLGPSHPYFQRPTGADEVERIGRGL